MTDAVRITIPSHPRYLAIVRSVSARTAEIHGLDQDAIEEIRLAVDEACANVMRHAYKGAEDKEIRLSFSGDKARFSVIIEDQGIKAHPERIEGRPLDDVRPGGLGVHLIRKAFDVVSFDRRKRKGNRLMLIRKRDS